MLKKHTAILALTTLLLNGSFALAEAPTSQFGFTGWPYRNETSCVSPTATPAAPTFPTAAPTQTAQATRFPAENGGSQDSAATCTPAATSAATTVPTRTPTAEPTRVPSMDEDYTTDNTTAQEQNAWNLLNSDRKLNGLSALPLDQELSAIARKKSEDMRDNHYFAHTSPTYGSVSDMLKHFGYTFTAAGENIAHHATVEKAQAAFMSSDGHRRNILSTSWTRVGIGVCQDAQGNVYVTQIFAR